MTTFLGLTRRLQNTQFWLLAIAGGLIAVHLSLTWRIDGDLSQMAMSALAWGAALSLLWEKRHNLSFESDIFSSVLGLLFIAFVLFRSLFVTGFDSLVQLSPVITALGLAMLASGVRLQQYWLELIILLAFNIPVKLLSSAIDISLLTAKFTNIVLTYLGFEVSRQGVNIILPTGAVEVYPGCSGIESIVQLLRVAILFLVMFPTDLAKKILVPVVAILIAFVVNGVRVSLMAVLVAYSSQEAFKYWHVGTGSQIFFLISILIFGSFCYFVSPKDDSNNQEPTEFSGS